MLLIKDIVIIDCREDMIELIKAEPMPSFPYGLDSAEIRKIKYNLDFAKSNKIKIEAVIGKIFRNIYNQEICIGMSKKVQNAIGLPFEIFTYQENLIYNQNKEINHLKNSIIKFEKTNRNLLRKVENLRSWKEYVMSRLFGKKQNSYLKE